VTIERGLVSVMDDAAAAEERAAVDDRLARFVAVHYDRLIRLANLVSRDGPDAADAVQLALEIAWRRRATLSAADSMKPWLDRIVVREAVRVARRRESRLVRLLRAAPDVAWVAPRRGSEPDHALWIAFQAAYRRLPPEQRAAVALHLHAGYSVAETAELVDAPPETVRSRLRLAKERLRRELPEEER
jgi:RNA polymerase sigma-70 factor (ECF subfamily)